MIKDILLLIGVLITISSVGIFIAALMGAPEGTEDETGFHYIKNGSPVSRPPFAAKSKRHTVGKSVSAARRHIPAA
jgi:hypothetical protein